jgi:outer membrane protein TolC
MRWKIVVTGLALAVATAVGCKEQCYMTQPDLDSYRNLMPACLETDLKASIVPSGSTTPTPATVLNSERESRRMSLAEAISLALENGSVGSPVLNGTSNLSLASFSGRGVFAPESRIQVLALDPAIVATDIEASLAKFDVRWNSSLTWNTTDRAVGSPFERFQAQSQNINFIQTDDAQFRTSLLKPLPTGGVAGITFTTDYENTNLPARVNPSYRPNVQFQFEQPLLQGYGVDINQLRASHPGSVLTPFQTGGRVEGILITRLRYDQQRAEFERQVHIMLVNVEVAYWNLYGSYWSLYSREQALRQSFEAWKINKERFEYGRIGVQDLAQTRGQYESFRAQRITALGQVMENERALRILIGLPVEDGKQLVPIDSPTLTPYRPDWGTSVNEALALRPELVLAREDLKFRQLDLISQKNLLLPDLRVTATYDINGLGSRLDGGANDPSNALHDLATNKTNDWALGLRMDYVLGYRDANAAVRSAKLNLARSFAVLKDQESRTEQFLALQYANLVQFYELIQAQRSQREAAAIALQARFKEFLAGRGTLDFLLEAQRIWADALRDEFQAVVQYNNTLATFEFAKGTILKHDNVVIAEGPLPKFAQVRAVDHYNERSKALVLRERDLIKPPVCEDNGKSYIGLPDIPKAMAPSVPAALEGQKNLEKMPDNVQHESTILRKGPVQSNGPVAEPVPGLSNPGTSGGVPEQFPNPRTVPFPDVKQVPAIPDSAKPGSEGKPGSPDAHSLPLSSGPALNFSESAGPDLSGSKPASSSEGNPNNAPTTAVPIRK